MASKFRSHHALALTLLLSAAPALAQQTYQLSIPSEPLAKALQRFAEQSGLSLVHYSRVAGAQMAPALEGVYTSDGALRKLLEKSGLEYRFVNPQTIEIREVTSRDAAQSANSIPDASTDSAAGMRVNGHRYIRLAQAEISEASNAGGRGEVSQNSDNGKSAKPGAAPQIEEVVVSISRSPSELRDLPLSIEVVGSAELEQQLGVSPDIQDTLNRLVPGLSLSTETGMSTGSGTGPLLRGRAATVLVNGVPINTILRGNGYDLNLIDSMAIDRIEVQRGASAAFGFGAPGGVISITTRKGKSAEPRFMLRSMTDWNPADVEDTLGYRLYGAVGEQRDNGVDYHFGIASSHLPQRATPNGGVAMGIEERDLNFDLNIGRQFANGSALRLTANYNHRDTIDDFVDATSMFPVDLQRLQTDGVLVPTQGGDLRSAVRDGNIEENDLEKQTNTVMLLSYEHPQILGSQLDVDLFYQRNHKRVIFTFLNWDFDTYENLPGLLNDNEFTDERLGLRSSLTSAFEVFSPQDLTLTYGVDLLRNEMVRWSNGSGGPLARTVLVDGTDVPFTYFFGSGEVAPPLVPPMRLDAGAAFVQGKLTLGDVILHAGVRHEEFRPTSLGTTRANTNYPQGDLASFDSTLFNVGAVWDITENFQLYGGLSQGTEITELGRVLADVGDGAAAEDLKRISGEPARTTEYELGVRGSLGRFNYTLAGFYSRAPLSAQVAQDPNDPFGPFAPIREPQRTYGVEATFDYQTLGDFAWGGVFSYQEGERKCDPAFEQELDCSVYTAQPSTRLNPAVISAYLQYTPSPAYWARLQLMNVFDRSPYNEPARFSDYDERGDVEGYFTADLLVNLAAGSGVFSLGVRNLLNESYVPVSRQASRGSDYLIPAEGRRVTLGYSVEF